MKTIKLTKGYETIVDDDDYERLSVFKWYYNHGYARRNVTKEKKQIPLHLHHEIIGRPEKGYVVDHINGNSLDNRKENLRFCTHSQNMRNRRKTKKQTSIYKGVCYKKPNKKYYARIVINGKKISLGLYRNEVDAAKAYNEAALKYYGEYASLNVI